MINSHRKPKNDCPICGRTGTEYGAFRNLKSHILKAARTELFNRELMNIHTKTPHFNFVKNNMHVVQVDISKQFIFKDNF